MNGTTTRARTGRGAARRYPAPPVVGANALQLDYPDLADDLIDDLVAERPYGDDFEPPTVRRRRRSEVMPDAVPAPSPLPFALPRTSFLITMVAIVIVGVVGVLVLNTKINENAFRLDDLHARQNVLDLQEQQLTRQLDELSSPGNLRAAARRLGLVPAGTPAFISLPDGRIVGVPQPATGAVSSAASPGR